MPALAPPKTAAAYADLTEACRGKGIEALCSPEDLSPGVTRSRARFRCLSCGHGWEATAYNVMRPGPKGSGCPACAKLGADAKKLARGEERLSAFAEELGYDPLQPYEGYFVRRLYRCRADGEEFSVAANNLLLNGQRCPACSGRSQHWDPAAAAAAATEGTTWGLDGPAPERGGESAFLCSACGAGRRLSWSYLIKVAKAERGDESRMCDCQRYGLRYAEHVASVPGYELLEPYGGTNVPILHRHTVCGTEWMCRPSGFRPGGAGAIRCPRCARSGRASRGQRELAEFVRSIGCEVREDVPGLDAGSPRSEVDVLALARDGRRVAVDFDGVWWHAEGPSRERSGRPRAAAAPGAAVAKADALAASGVQLVRVYSDEWSERREAVESRLRAILGRPLEALSARSLLVDADPDPSEVRSFLSRCHTQGAPPLQSAALALRRPDGSVAAAMTFGERTLGRGSSSRLELLRYCCSPGSSVRGGAGRLLSAFRRGYATDAAELTTYADLRWSPVWGSRMYESVGFLPRGRTAPTYDYVHPSQPNRRVSRIAMQRHKLLAANPGLDPGLTEGAMAASLGYSRVWGSGNLRYALPLP